MRKHLGGTVSELKAHLVLVVKYRKRVFTPERLARLEVLVKECGKKWDCEIQQVNGEANHIHVLFEYSPTMELSKFANNLKTVTSRYMRKEFPGLKDEFNKPVLWKVGYYVGSCGGVTVDVIKRYIERQDRPT